jgi:hypothetical protein
MWGAQKRFRNQLCFESFLRGTRETSISPACKLKKANWVPGVVGGTRLIELESQSLISACGALIFDILAERNLGKTEIEPAWAASCF